MLEVVIPAESFDLTTVEAVCNEFGLDDGDTSDNIIISSWIGAASDVISKYCKRTFPAQTYRETFYNSHHRHELLLSQFPVAEVSEVIENGVTMDTNTAGIANAEVHADTGYLMRLYNDNPAHWPLGKIVVTYSAGFSTATGYPTMPGAIERAAILLVGIFRNRAKTDPAIRGISHGDLTVQFGLGPLANGGDLPAEVKALLQPYRDYRVR